MKNGIPRIYWTFRYAWSIAHILIFLILGLWLVIWLLQGGRGAEMFDAASYQVQDLSNQLASLVPFPWNA